MTRPPALVLHGGTIIDGTGASVFRGDVRIEDGLITAIGEVDISTGASIIDVDGHVVAPGFIDMHSHSDLALFSDPSSALKVRQGITTEVIRQDGTSYAPASPRGLTAARELFAPVNGEGETLDWSWRSVREFLALYRAIGPNVAYLLPQGTIRFSVVGMDERRATASEMNAMRQLVDEGMRDGAFGISTGLTYPPGAWTPTEEVIELSKIAAAHGGLYVTHHRDYGSGLADAIGEALEIGRGARIPVHFSHFHVSGPDRDSRATEFLRPIDDARASGQRVTLDVYPYEAGCTTLTAFLPDWLRSRPVAEVLAILQDREGHARVVDALRTHGPGKSAAVGWENFVVGAACGEGAAELRGKRLGELAHARALPLEELVCELITTTSARVAVLVFQGHASNIHRTLEDPKATIGTDGLPACGVPHPRAAGTFPRLLRYAREGTLDLVTTIEMMTGRAAATLGLRDRGTLRAGQAADVVVFDPIHVRDLADYANPTEPPVGIVHVLVNGSFVVRDSMLTGNLPGRVLRKAPTS